MLRSPETSDILLPVTYKVSPEGHLVVGGCDVVELGRKYGTPLYIMDITTIKNQCRSYVRSFSFPDLKAEIIFASKAFISIAMCQLVKSEGLSIDVSTGGELYIALKSGFPPERIFFHGNNKSKEEIRFGLENKVGFFIVDNFHELEALETLCREYGVRQKIMLRITPGIEASTHKYIQTGKIESKFGFDLHHGFAFEAVKRVIKSESLVLSGLHAHIGSQIFNLSCYEKLISKMVGFIRDIGDKLGIHVGCINIGGGLGIKYVPEDTPPTVEYFSQVIFRAIKDSEKRYGVKLEKLCLEPGRSI
ncbi:MAG: diaminopimelate decarboxylase, partial [Actinobacteria bacterium]|nr:diaminopimelate decarboxylase [Actinomycetota bacterium]